MVSVLQAKALISGILLPNNGQTWVDNAGGTNEYRLGKFDNNKIIYSSTPIPFSKNTMAIRKMTFTNLSPVKLRQHGEISKDNGVNWAIEYDLEYRRRK